MTAKDRIKELQRIIGMPSGEQDGIIGVKTLTAFGQKCNKTSWQVGQFFANVHHETGGFSVAEENLNYSAERIVVIWPSRFKSIGDAAPYARNPRALANKVYGGRMGNIVHKDDGWNFRGRGALQLTGRNNYQAFSEYVGDPSVMTNPDIVATKYFWQSALFYFDRNNVWNLTTTQSVRRAVNGGNIGLSDVEKLLKKYYI